MVKCCSPLTIESRGSGSVNGKYNRRIYRKSGLRVPAPRHAHLVVSLRFFFSFFLSLSLSLFLSHTHIFRSPFFVFFFSCASLNNETLLTEKERHEAACNERGWEVDAAAQVAGGTGLDYQRHGVVPGGRHGCSCGRVVRHSRNLKHASLPLSCLSPPRWEFGFRARVPSNLERNVSLMNVDCRLLWKMVCVCARVCMRVRVRRLWDSFWSSIIYFYLFFFLRPFRRGFIDVRDRNEIFSSWVKFSGVNL